MLGVDVAQHLLSEPALHLRGERVSRPEVTQQVRPHGARPHGEPAGSRGPDLEEMGTLNETGMRRRRKRRRAMQGEREVGCGGGGGGGGHGSAKTVYLWMKQRREGGDSVA